MKRSITAILIFLLLPPTLYCQSELSFAQLYNQFAHEKNAEKLHINSFLMLLARPFIKQHIDGITVSAIQILDLDDCSKDVRLKFNRSVNRLNHNKYSLLMKVHDGEEKVQIFARLKQDKIRELIIISNGSNCSLVRIKGRIKPEDIARLVNGRGNAKRRI